MKRLFTIVILCCTLFGAAAEVRLGKLPNGLTYYIMRHTEPSGQAEFFLTQRIGSVQERENERGMAHFLEHMAFNGTEHFPGNTLITYLESLGVKFGADLNAYTSADETVYNISRVPVARQSSLDSCLLILRDWSCALSLTDADINSERGVIEGEWRHRTAASSRILQQILPDIYSGNIYGRRMPIGLMSVVRNFPPSSLRGFYRRWHRPANQAVIVVGDIDVDVVENRVKELFSAIPAVAGNDATRPSVADNKKLIVAVGSDAEQNANLLQLHFKFVKPQLEGEDYWRRKAGEELLVNMLVERFDSLERSPQCAWSNMGIGTGRFFLSSGVRSLVMRATVKGGAEPGVFSAWYAEVLRVLDHGFTGDELDIAKRIYMSSLARRRADRLSNTACARRWSRHFLDGGPAIGHVAELDSLQAVVEGITPEYCAGILESIADRKGSGCNMVVVAMRPENKAMPKLDAGMIRKAFAAANDLELEPWHTETVCAPLLAQEPERGSVAAVDSVADLGCRLITLGNGVKVYAKKTDFKHGEFYLAGIGPGGFSQRYTPQLAPHMKLLNDVMPHCGYGGHNVSQLRRLSAGKDMAVSVKISPVSESVELKAGAADREDAFRLLYLKLTSPQADRAAFDMWRSAALENISGTAPGPVKLMADSIHSNVYNHHPLGVKETADTYRVLDIDTVIGIYRDRFADMSDFTFYVCGDFGWDELTGLLERYVATLPASGRMERPRDIGYRYTRGRNEIRFTMDMQTPVAIEYSFLSGPAEYTLKNYIIAGIAGQILKKRLLRELREEKGWTYSVTGHCSINPDLGSSGSASFLWPVYVKTAPEHAGATMTAVEEAFRLMAAEGITDEELESERLNLMRDHKEGLTSNAYWLSAMRAYHRHGLNFPMDYDATLRTITASDIKSFVAGAASADRTRITLTPR